MTKVYELVVQYPPPIWQSPSPTPRHSNRSQAGELFVLEHIPEDEAFPAAWTREHKFWPSVGRVNDVHGDRNLVCACPPVEEYA